MLRANRAEGRSTLLALAAAQEKFYLQCNTYAATLDSEHGDRLRYRPIAIFNQQRARVLPHHDDFG